MANKADGLSNTKATSGFITKPSNIELLQRVNKNREWNQPLNAFLHSTHEFLALYNVTMCVEYEGSKPLASLLEADFGTYNGKSSIAL